MIHSSLTRPRILILLALALMAVYAIIGVLDARAGQARLADARRDLADVKQMIADMERWKQAPKVAALRLESPAEIANRVAAAREAAGIPQSALLKEQPMEPQRIGRTDFEMRSTEIDLAASTLPAILKFCDGLRDPDTGTIVRDIRLTEPQTGVNGGGQEKWEAGLTLTQMIFSPKSR